MQYIQYIFWYLYHLFELASMLARTPACIRNGILLRITKILNNFVFDFSEFIYTFNTQHEQIRQISSVY